MSWLALDTVLIHCTGRSPCLLVVHIRALLMILLLLLLGLLTLLLLWLGLLVLLWLLLVLWLRLLLRLVLLILLLVLWLRLLILLLFLTLWLLLLLLIQLLGVLVCVIGRFIRRSRSVRVYLLRKTFMGSSRRRLSIPRFCTLCIILPHFRKERGLRSL